MNVNNNNNQNVGDDVLNTGPISTPLRVPGWIADTAPLMPVYFTVEADAELHSLRKLTHRKHKKQFKADKRPLEGQSFLHCRDINHARDFIVQVCVYMMSLNICHM